MVDFLEFPAGPDAPDVPPMLDSQVHAANPDHLHITNVLDVTETAADPCCTTGPSYGYPGSRRAPGAAPLAGVVALYAAEGSVRVWMVRQCDAAAELPDGDPRAARERAAAQLDAGGQAP
eukprot:gene14056-biopygen8263